MSAGRGRSPRGARGWLGVLTALAALAAGCPGDDDDAVADDDTADDDTADDDSGDDDTADDDTTPEDICVELPNGEDLDGTVCGAAAACRFAEVETSAFQGYAMAGGRDFDGDGLEDLAVGVPGHDVKQDEGRVSVYTIASLEVLLPGPVATVDGDAPLQAVGSAVALVDDLDGDGTGDLVIGARGDATGGEGAGAVMVVHGRGLAGDPAAPEALGIDTTIRGEAAFSRAGTAVTGLGDVDGDGLGELAFGHTLYLESAGHEFASDGAVAVFRGAPGGLAATLSTGDADWTFEAPLSAGQLGYALDGRGDITGDGVADLAMGAPEYNAGRGELYVVPGAALAALAPGAHWVHDEAAIVVSGEEYGENVGGAIAFAGDVDGDGVGDLAVGAPGSSAAAEEGGAVYLFAGSPDIEVGTPPAMLATIGSEFDDFALGGRLANHGDLDGDGLGDVVVGAVDAYLGPITKGGRAYLFHGRTAGWDALVDATDADAGVAGLNPRDKLGHGLALSDLDGDGADELVVAAPYHEATGIYSGEIYLFWGPSR